MAIDFKGIKRKSQKFVHYKIEAPFLYARIYLEKDSTDFSVVFTNGLLESRRRFQCIIRLETIN